MYTLDILRKDPLQKLDPVKKDLIQTESEFDKNLILKNLLKELAPLDIQKELIILIQQDRKTGGSFKELKIFLKKKY